VAVKLYRDRSELPVPVTPTSLNVCQLVSRARYGGEVRAGTAETMVCSLGASCLGLIETPEALASGRAALGSYAKNLEAARRFMQNTYKLGDRGKQFDAVLIGPLGSLPAVPDVIIVYGNPAQLMRLIHANSFDTGEKTVADTVAEGAVCASIAFALEEGEARVDFPCAGDRRYGGVQKDELLFSMPYRLGERIVRNLRHTLGSSLPGYLVAPNVLSTPAMSEDYTIQPEDLE
jgi:uncharacterized protein (DUF169 family)